LLASIRRADDLLADDCAPDRRPGDEVAHGRHRKKPTRRARRLVVRREMGEFIGIKAFGRQPLGGA